MKYDPNVYGYVNGKPTYSRDEFIFTVRGFGPIENDADLLAFAEKVTSRWYNAGWHQTFATYYLSDYALSEPGRSLTVKEFNRLKEIQQAAREAEKAADDAREWKLHQTIYWADNSVEEIWIDKNGAKPTAALAAEQADTEATTTQEAELLPAATLDELEQVDLGTVAEGERAPFRITDDRCADWAIRKIADERSEYDRLKALADEQIAAINEKVAAARKRMENGTSYLTSCLADFFATVPHKETKTTEKYRLLSGTLTFKKGTTKTKLDETKLVPWLKANGYGELVKVEESTRWADLKKLLSYTGDIATLTETGEIVEGVTVYETPGIFTVDV